MRKILAVITAALLTVSLSACANGADDRDLHREQTALMETASPEIHAETEAADLPAVSSAEAELYSQTVGNDRYVVNAYGFRTDAYTLDRAGNICDSTGKITVAAANAAGFVHCRSIVFDAGEYTAALKAEEVFNADRTQSEILQRETDFRITVNVSPIDITCRVLVLSISDTGTVSFNANKNAKVIADGEYGLSADEIALSPDENGQIVLVFTAKKEGSAQIAVRELNGGTAGSAAVKVTNGELSSEPGSTDTRLSDTVYASEVWASHTHVYAETVVAPTLSSKGYTLYFCSCGKTYTDRYTAPLTSEPAASAHIHDYKASVVAPTASERGYTLHVCECGDSYRDSFVYPVGNGEA